MPAEHPATIGPYPVVQFLGQAGQCSVYRGERPKDGTPVAIKLFPAHLAVDPQMVERFHRELALFAPKSRHPHLVQVLGTGQEGERLFVAMEYVAGTSLDRLLKERRLTVQEAFAVFKGICRALLYAHQQGVVHRGLTPRHVLVTPDLATVKVSDFVASAFETAHALTGTLSTGEIKLSALYYLAPELVEGRAADHRVDVYSAGAIFHEMLTGRTPGAKLALPSQLNPELPPETDVLVLKCLSRNPEERFASAAELLAELERLEETLRLRLLSEIRGISHAGSRLLTRTPEGTGRKRLMLILLGLGLLLGLAAAAYLLFS
jgi:serine/threonine-protein kinase